MLFYKFVIYLKKKMKKIVFVALIVKENINIKYL